jgi:hypothetical protein
MIKGSSSPKLRSSIRQKVEMDLCYIILISVRAYLIPICAGRAFR